MSSHPDTTPPQPASTGDDDPVEELKDRYPPILTTGQVAEMLHCTVGDVRDKTHQGELEAMRWGQQFRFFRNDVIAALRPYPCKRVAEEPTASDGECPDQSPTPPAKPIDYDSWYPEVPAVLNTTQLADLLDTSNQVIRAWARNKVIPAHRGSGNRKFWYLRHEIFDWLVANSYEPSAPSD